VQDKSSRNQDSKSEAVMADVSAADIRSEISGLLREAAKPVQPGESVKALVRRAARRMALPYNRARHLWYEEINSIPAHEADTIRRRFEWMARERRKVRERDDEIQDLKRRLQALEERQYGAVDLRSDGGAPTVLGLGGPDRHGEGRGAEPGGGEDVATRRAG